MAVMFCQKCGSNVKMPHHDCPNEGKHMIVYVLVYNEWDGGGGDISENVIASYNKEKLEAYKKDIEDRSVGVREKLMQMEAEIEKKLRPLWDEMHPLLMQKRTADWRCRMTDEERKPILERERAIHDQLSVVNQEAYKAKNEYIESLNLPYIIDDPDSSNLIIEELHLI
jgi:DNA repair exonuclease SbcCD ATPase subunit